VVGGPVPRIAATTIESKPSRANGGGSITTLRTTTGIYTEVSRLREREKVASAIGSILIFLVPGSAWNPWHLRLLPPQCLHLSHNEAEPLSIGIPG